MTLFGFNVRADSRAKALLEKDGIEVRYYGVIYELLDDLKVALSGMLAPEIREEIIGIAEVRDVLHSLVLARLLVVWSPKDPSLKQAH